MKTLTIILLLACIPIFAQDFNPNTKYIRIHIEDSLHNVIKIVEPSNYGRIMQVMDSIYFTNKKKYKVQFLNLIEYDKNYEFITNTEEKFRAREKKKFKQEVI